MRIILFALAALCVAESATKAEENATTAAYNDQQFDVRITELKTELYKEFKKYVSTENIAAKLTNKVNELLLGDSREERRKSRYTSVQEIFHLISKYFYFHFKRLVKVLYAHFPSYIEAIMEHLKKAPGDEIPDNIVHSIRNRETNDIFEYISEAVREYCEELDKLPLQSVPDEEKCPDELFSYGTCTEQFVQNKLDRVWNDYLNKYQSAVEKLSSLFYKDSLDMKY